MTAGKIHIGTSGWNYKDWSKSFYPEEVREKDFLPYYAKNFKSVEINNSFYALPKAATSKKWREQTPDDFLFAIKASRYMTHNKKLKDPEESLQRFFKGIKPLNRKMGPILFQLPPKWNVNIERLEEFLNALKHYKHRFTFECRHESWFCAEIYDLLRHYNAALCIYHLAGFKSPQIMTADFTYVRLHGPGKAYQGSYDKRTLAAYARRFKEWSKNGQDVFCYFDNDQKGYAPKDARTIQELLTKKAG